MVLGAAPVAPVEVLALLEGQARRDRLAPLLRIVGHHDDRPVPKGLGGQIEEAVGQVGDGPLAQAGVPIEAPHRVPDLRGQRVPGEGAHLETGLGDHPPLLAGLLSHRGAEAAQELVEARVAGTLPMELQRAPREEAVARGHAPLVVGEEVQVDARGPHAIGGFARPLQEGGDHRLAVGAFAVEEAAPGRRGEGGHGDQLRVVGDAGAVGRVGPAPVEDVLPVALVLHVERERAQQGPALPHRDVERLPAGVFADGARALEGVQEGVFDEGIALAGQRVPVAGLDLGEALQET